MYVWQMINHHFISFGIHLGPNAKLHYNLKTVPFNRGDRPIYVTNVLDYERWPPQSIPNTRLWMFEYLCVKMYKAFNTVRFL